MPYGTPVEHPPTKRELTEYGHMTLRGRFLNGSVELREAAECAAA